MKQICIFLLVFLSFIPIIAQKAPIIANPLNLNYQFQAVPLEAGLGGLSYREAADPEIHLFKGKYYLFASHSGGYWRSDDLAEWTYIACRSISIIGNYAPTVLNMNDTLYYMASGSSRIFWTVNPDKDKWQELANNKLTIVDTDPAFFLDDDGKVYLYWGCSDKKPIMGVELDPHNGFAVIGEPKVLITHNSEKYGWEAQWNKDGTSRNGWNEGANMIKHKGKYYLQYAAPGTELRGYADGVYIGNSPLGDFLPQESNPFSIKPGGFIGGAGHGNTFYDKFGNLWHVTTMRISVRHMFERRIGLFPAYFTEDGRLLAKTVWTDYPFRISQEKTDFAKNDFSMNWSLLSFNKNVTASTSLKNYEPEKANDEQIETCWSAASGKADEWWQIDLGMEQEIKAIQVNFADQDFPFLNSFAYQYKILCSNNGKDWKTLVDRSNNKKNMPHDLIILNKFIKTRFLRIVNTKDMPNGKFSLSDFRVFGGDDKYEEKIDDFSAVRDENDKRIYRLKWEKQPEAQGYILRWGVKPNKLHNAVMIHGTEFEGRFFNVDSEYFFQVTAF